MAGNWIGRAAYGGLRLGRARAQREMQQAGAADAAATGEGYIQHAVDTADDAWCSGRSMDTRYTGGSLGGR